MNSHPKKKAWSLLLSAMLLTGSLLAATFPMEAFPILDNKAFLSEDMNTIPLYALANQPEPSPDLSPLQVIALQLKALQANDSADRGIAITFNFAAPANKVATGPLEQFKKLVKNPTYAPMINFTSYTANKIHIEGNEAQQIVIITDKDGNKAAYLFSLSRQTEGSYKGCWMTDGVIRLKYEEKILKV